MMDGRGSPGRYVSKASPKLRLADLLRRRRTTLKEFANTLGISTYGALEIHCRRVGVSPPTEEEFREAIPQQGSVNSAQEGVVVLSPIPVIDEFTGREIDPDLPVTPPGVSVLTGVPDQSDKPSDEQPADAATGAQKKQRRKRDSQPTD